MLRRSIVNTILSFTFLSSFAGLFFIILYPDTYTFSSNTISRTIINLFTITYYHIAIHLYWFLTILWNGYLLNYQYNAFSRMNSFWSVFDFFITYQLYSMRTLTNLYQDYPPSVETSYVVGIALFIGAILAYIYVVWAKRFYVGRNL